MKRLSILLVFLLVVIVISGCSLVKRAPQKPFQDYLTPMMYGAKGDGKKDDTEALRRAIYESDRQGKVLYFPSGYQFRVAGTLNYYQGKYHSYKLNMLGCIPIKNGSYSPPKNGGIAVDKGVSLFKSAIIQGSIERVCITGKRDLSVRFFDHCECKGLVIHGCNISNFGVLFADTKVHSVSQITQNTFLTLYYFSKNEDTSSGFMDSSISFNYINGGVELNDKEVLNEWLYMKKQREINVFAREGSDIKFNKEQINVKVASNIVSAEMVSSTSSFLAVLKTFNEPLATKIVDWFDGAIVISANDIRSAVPLQYLADEERKKVITKFMKAFDFNIEDMNLHEIRIEDVPEKVKAMIGEENLTGPLYDGISTSHRQYNELYERVGDVWFSLEKDESYGTNRLFWLSWAIISALEQGTVLFIDEYDSGIHPYIARQVVEMFYRCKTKAQLIINTQNASLLRYKTEDEQKLFVKNQVYIVDKNRYGESTLTPLTDFSSDMRSNLENLYLDGDFGGVPYVSMNGLMDLIQREDK